MHRAVVEQGCRGGILPLLDGFGRNRAQYSCRMHRLVFGERATVTVESLAVWVLFECIFRYTGDAKVLDTFFFNVDHLKEVKDAAAHGVLRLEVLLREILRREVQGRTSVKALFSTRDGRRRTYRKKRGLGEDVVVATVAPDSKFFDHMMIALEMWGSQATGVAQGLFDLMQCIEAQTDNLREDERLVLEECLCRSNQDQGQGEQNVSHGVRERLECMERVMEDFMFCLLGLDLLGRPAGRASLQGTERFWCYHLKFILNDCYCLMAAFLCGEQRRRPASECTCIRCRAIWFLRCRYIFFGPSPLALHCGLLCQAPGTDRVQRTTVTVWRQLRALLERELGGHWDLYAVQMLPCTWRSFLVTALKYRDSDDVQVEWITSARRQVLRVFELETVRLAELRAWLRYFGMQEEEFGGLPAAVQRDVLAEVQFLPSLKAGVLRKLFAKAVARHLTD